ncbi:MAG: type II toxin-antitoxin system RelE/ParE family toxin [Deltaproteobacteria bacterium]|nr:type II toxin-antitoxin system RelE/ParE family toxin [Deltaproteobacteria bacterium]
MISNFASSLVADIYEGVKNKTTRKISAGLHAKIRRLLDQLNAAPSLEFMRVLPGNRLEKLSGNLKSYWSVRINDQWRLIFRWHGEDAFDVNIVDYH